MAGEPEQADEPLIDEEAAGRRFTAETALIARNIGVEKARAEMEERRAFALERIAVATEIIGAWEPHLDEKALGKLFKAAAAKVAMGVLTGEIECRHAADAASVIDKLANAGRLEFGQATARVENIDGQDQAERIRTLRDAAQEKLDDLAKAQADAEQVEKVRTLSA